MLERFSYLLNRVYNRVHELESDEGQTTVEYAVVLVLVVVMAIAVFATLQGGVSSVMTAITDKIKLLIPNQL